MKQRNLFKLFLHIKNFKSIFVSGDDFSIDVRSAVRQSGFSNADISQTQLESQCPRQPSCNFNSRYRSGQWPSAFKDIFDIYRTLRQFVP